MRLSFDNSINAEIWKVKLVDQSNIPKPERSSGRTMEFTNLYRPFLSTGLSIEALIALLVGGHCALSTIRFLSWPGLTRPSTRTPSYVIKALMMLPKFGTAGTALKLHGWPGQARPGRGRWRQINRCRYKSLDRSWQKQKFMLQMFRSVEEISAGLAAT